MLYVNGLLTEYDGKPQSSLKTRKFSFIDSFILFTIFLIYFELYSPFGAAITYILLLLVYFKFIVDKVLC